MTNAADDHGETEVERRDRNWTEILQELRVAQTGAQILTGFLLTLVFQPRFEQLDELQVGLYLVLVILAAFTTAMALAPVSMHRTLFRRGAKEQIVQFANTVLKIALGGVALVLTGTIALIFDMVLGHTAAFVAGGLTLVLIVVAWIALPGFARRRSAKR